MSCTRRQKKTKASPGKKSKTCIEKGSQKGRSKKPRGGGHGNSRKKSKTKDDRQAWGQKKKGEKWRVQKTRSKKAETDQTSAKLRSKLMISAGGAKITKLKKSRSGLTSNKKAKPEKRGRRGGGEKDPNSKRSRQNRRSWGGGRGKKQKGRGKKI